MAMFAIGVAAATAQVATMNLSGSVPAELNGKKMYIINLDTRERIDSAVVGDDFRLLLRPLPAPVEAA